MKKTRAVAGISAPVAIFSAALFASEKLYDFAFKRVDYVPETSADKQKYADAILNTLAFIITLTARLQQ